MPSNPRPPIDVRLFAYLQGVPDFPEGKQLDWAFEIQAGPEGLEPDGPTIYICHAKTQDIYRAWIDWLMARLAADPNCGIGLLFVSGDPPAASESVKRIRTDRLEGSKVPIEAEKAWFDTHIRVLKHPLPMGATRVANDARVRDTLDEFIHWVKERPWAPPLGSFDKVWDLLDQDNRRVSDELNDFVEIAVAVISAILQSPEQARALRIALWAQDDGESNLFSAFASKDAEYHARHYPLDLQRQALRHTWLKHRVLLPLREVERLGNDGREQRIRQEIEVAWVELEPRLLNLLKFAEQAAHTDPFARATVYLRLVGDGELRVALNNLLTKRPALAALVEEAGGRLSETPVAPGRAEAIAVAKAEIDTFGRLLGEGAALDALKAQAVSLDQSLELARINPGEAET